MSATNSAESVEKPLLKRHVIDRVMVVAVPLLVLILLTWTMLGQSIVSRVDDQIARWMGYHSASNIVLINLDDRSIEQLGGWPISRSHYAHLLTRLAQPDYRPRAVGIDILFLDPRPDDAELASAMQRLPVVLPVYKKEVRDHLKAQGLGQWQRPVPVLTQATTQGHIHMRLDSDGVVRGFQPMVEGVPHMALAMAEAADLTLNRSPRLQTEVRVQMVDPAVGFPTISMADALDPRFPLEIVKNKWVLVGSTANSLGDMHVTPNTVRTGAPTPGVLVLASDLNAVVHEDWIEVADKSAVFAFSVWLLAMLVFLTSQWRPAVMLRLQMGIIVVVTGLQLLLLVQAQWWLNTVPFCLALPFGWLYWVTRKLEHTFAFMKRQVQDLPPSLSVGDSMPSGAHGSALPPWPQNWHDPIKSISDELQARTAQMQDSLRLLDAIIRQLPDALAVFDAHGGLVISNPGMRRYLVWQSLSVTDTDPALTLPLLRETLGFDPNTTIAPGSPILLMSPLGKLHYLCTESVINDALEMPLHLVRMHDITPLREQESQRKKTLEFLSHDMRAPVAAIAAVAEGLARKHLQGGPIAHSVNDIVQYTEHLMQMMDGFIDYSQASQAELKTDVHLVSNLLDDALSQVQALAEQQQTRFVVDESEYPLAIDCNARLMVRALVNTLVNALHHGQTGGEVWVRTELVVHPIQPMALLEVRNLVGEVPSRPLVRGFGLGLEFVRMVMARHGGSMHASWWNPESVPPASLDMAVLRLEMPNIALDTEGH